MVQDNKIHLYAWNGTELKEDGVLDTPRGPALTLAFSPDGKLLVAGDVSAHLSSLLVLMGWCLIELQATGKITLFSVEEKKVTFHPIKNFQYKKRKS